MDEAVRLIKASQHECASSQNGTMDQPPQERGPPGDDLLFGMRETRTSNIYFATKWIYRSACSTPREGAPTAELGLAERGEARLGGPGSGPVGPCKRSGGPFDDEVAPQERQGSSEGTECKSKGCAEWWIGRRIFIFFREFERQPYRGCSRFPREWRLRGADKDQEFAPRGARVGIFP